MYNDLSPEKIFEQRKQQEIQDKEIVMTKNLRGWRHFFKLRAAGIAGKPHPQMLEITLPMLAEFKSRIPVVFDDILV
jgi:thymidylate synthase ThyX